MADHNENLKDTLNEEIEHADTQALGVPLPDPVSGDKRLRTLCEAMLHAPTTRSTLASTQGSFSPKAMLATAPAV